MGIAPGLALEEVAGVVSRHLQSYKNTLEKLIWISRIPGEVFGIIHFCGRTLQVSIRKRTAKTSTSPGHRTRSGLEIDAVIEGIRKADDKG
jgi:hypothetical protein